MNPNPVHRLPPTLEAAVQRMKLAARGAAERAVEALGLAALSASQATQRDDLLDAQFELNRRSAMFILAFNEAYDDRVSRELAPRSAAATESAPTSWNALSLVEDSEVELLLAADRFALEIGHLCEGELRELESYMTTLLGDGRNPVRPEIIGHAMVRGAETVAQRPAVRKLLGTEIARALSAVLRSTYQDVIADLRRAGVAPAGLSVRTSEARSAGATSPAADALSRDEEMRGRSRGSQGGASMAGGLDSRPGGPRSRMGGFAHSAHSGFGGGQGGTPLGHVDPAVMSLIRRLAFTDFAGSGGGQGGRDDAVVQGSVDLPNMIRVHREELRQAATGALDHLVIDVIGTLFDQILSDPKVAPQMARQIGRLQLPVLRAALGDPAFFSSRRHPVRRFVNRLASLGAAFEDFGDERAQRFLGKVRDLVQQVVEGDFDRIEVYELKLGELEAFVAEQALQEVDAQSDATRLLAAKEDELRLRALYAQQLQGDLQGLTAPDFVRDFVSQVWSQVLVQVGERDGADGARAQRLRHAGRELFMSVQPKTSPAHRKAFLADLPKLMQELTEGMDLIGWPQEARRAFFGQLLPAHAESLKGQPQRTLDFNMLSRQVDGALERALPSAAALQAAPANLPVLTEAIFVPQFSAEEARRIGLVDEARFDWNGKLDIDLDAEPEIKAADVHIPALSTEAAASEPLEPTQGKLLAEHVQIGFAYQMHLEGGWHKARLSHISPGRSFFVFTHGHQQLKTVSLTHRMLARMCEAGRVRAYESAYLLERATARARRQLASLRPA